MVARHPVRRRPARAPRAKTRRSPAAAFTSGPARAAYVIVGTIGLAALAAAILGPKRLQRDVFQPLQQTVGPQAEKLWDQARPLRAQLSGLFRRAGDEREKLARDFQSWIGRFHAS